MKIASQLKLKLKEAYMILLPGHFKKRSFKNLMDFQWNDLGKKNFEAEFLFLEKLLKPESVFFDVGANIGQFIAISSKYIPQNQIYAFEPNPLVFKRLTRLFKRVHVHRVALSNSNGNATLNIPSESGKSLDTRGSLLEFGHQVTGMTFKVPTKTIDTFIAENRVSRIDLIKIDVEGFEKAVLEGAVNALEKYKPVIIAEIDRYHYSDSLTDIFNFIDSLNYTPFYFDISSKRMVEISADTDFMELQNPDHRGLNKQYVNNYFLVHKSNDPVRWCNQIQDWIDNQKKSN
jgi:FkbM family methyltransferase